MQELEVKTGTCLIEIPENAIRVKVTATLIDKDLKQQEAEMILDLPDIIDARIVGEEWHMENDTYVLTDKCKEMMENAKG